MRKEYYIGLRDYIKNEVPDIELIDLDLKQYNQSGDDIVRITPAVYIDFKAIDWDTLLTNIQRTVLDFTVTLVSSTRYGDERDIMDEDNINHLDIERRIYIALMSHRIKLSEVSGYENVKETNLDLQLMESIVRVGTGTHRQINNLIVTSTPYRCVAFDYTAAKVWQKVMAQLELDIKLVDKIEN